MGKGKWVREGREGRWSGEGASYSRHLQGFFNSRPNRTPVEFAPYRDYKMSPEMPLGEQTETEPSVPLLVRHKIPVTGSVLSGPGDEYRGS